MYGTHVRLVATATAARSRLRTFLAVHLPDWRRNRVLLPVHSPLRTGLCVAKLPRELRSRRANRLRSTSRPPATPAQPSGLTSRNDAVRRGTDVAARFAAFARLSRIGHQEALAACATLSYCGAAVFREDTHHDGHHVVRYLLEGPTVEVTQRPQVKGLQKPVRSSAYCLMNIQFRMVSSAEVPRSRTSCSPRSRNAAYRSALPRG